MDPAYPLTMAGQVNVHVPGNEGRFGLVVPPLDLESIAYSQGLAEVMNSKLLAESNDFLSDNTCSNSQPSSKKRKMKKTEDSEKHAHTKKRSKNEQLWKCNLRKERKNKGQCYLSTRGQLVEGRQFRQAGCTGKCQYKCGSKVSMEQRVNIFHHYWDLGDYVKQREFIAKHIERVNKLKSTKRNVASRRQWTIQYFFTVDGERARVCRAFFLNTLSISEATVRVVLEKIHEGLPWGMGEMFEDKRGRHQKSEPISDPQAENPPEDNKDACAPYQVSPPTNAQPVAVDATMNALPSKNPSPTLPLLTQTDFLETVGLQTQETKSKELGRVSKVQNTCTQKTGTDFSQQSQQCQKDRKRDPSKWKCNVRKKLKNSGQSYVSTSGKQVEAKVFTGTGCKTLDCRYKCDKKISKEQRQKIFESYWKLGNNTKQRQYIALHVERTKTLSRTTEKAVSRRQFTQWYYLTIGLDRFQVCRSFFLKTLGVTEQSVRTVLRRLDERETIHQAVNFEERRGKHGVKTHKLSPAEEQYIRGHVQKCLAEIPDSKNRLSKMYNVYKEECVKENPPMKPACEVQYKRIAKESCCAGRKKKFAAPGKVILVTDEGKTLQGEIAPSVEPSCTQAPTMLDQGTSDGPDMAELQFLHPEYL